jgi:hypothetical protein
MEIGDRTVYEAEKQRSKERLTQRAQSSQRRGEKRKAEEGFLASRTPLGMTGWGGLGGINGRPHP